MHHTERSSCDRQSRIFVLSLLSGGCGGYILYKSRVSIMLSTLARLGPHFRLSVLTRKWEDPLSSSETSGIPI